MSSSNETAQAIAAYVSWQTESWIEFAPMVVLFYDFVITFGREVNLYWSSKVTGASVLLIIIRYYSIIVIIIDLSKTDKRYACCHAVLACAHTNYCYAFHHSCAVLVKVDAMMGDLVYLPIAVFSLIRSYALTRSRITAGLVFMLSMAPVGVNLGQYILGEWGSVVPVFGCEVLVRFTSTEGIICISRLGLICADLILIVVTWRSLGIPTCMSWFARPRAGLTEIMVTNGLVYFVVLFVLNVLHLSLNLSGTTLLGHTGGLDISEITSFTDPLTTILTWRFLLDLQEASKRSLRVDADGPLNLSDSSNSTPSFVRFVGSIGATIRSGDHVDSEDEEWPATYASGGAEVGPLPGDAHAESGMIMNDTNEENE